MLKNILYASFDLFWASASSRSRPLEERFETLVLPAVFVPNVHRSRSIVNEADVEKMRERIAILFLALATNARALENMVMVSANLF